MFVTIEPVEGVAHRLGIEPAGDGAPGLRPGDKPGARQHVEMLHHCRQRHREWRGEFADRQAGLGGKPHHQRAARRIGERGKGAVERGFRGGQKLNHMV